MNWGISLNCVLGISIDISTERFTYFWKAKFPDDGSVLGSNQFSVLPQLPKK